jgi:thioredoxin reductase
MMRYGAIIVGGSFAGLSAALYLATARRSVLIFDTGVSSQPLRRHFPWLLRPGRQRSKDHVGDHARADGGLSNSAFPRPGSRGCGARERRIVTVDEMKATNIAGVYTAGDITRMGQTVTFACADGVMAALAIHRSLIFGTEE